MYLVMLSLHNVLRWVVVVFAVIVLVRAYRGWLRKEAWTEMDRKTSTYFAIALDIQFLIGLILYIFLSPITKAAFANFGAVMGSEMGGSDLRFFALEHILLMVIVVAAVHMGSVFSRRAKSDESRHRTAAIWYSLAVLLVIVGIPWPVSPVARPWLRLPF